MSYRWKAKSTTPGEYRFVAAVAVAIMQSQGGNILVTDVRSDTATGAAAGGTVTLPAEDDVRDGEGYGAGGTEFEGTLDIEADNPPIGNQGLAMGL